MEPINIIDLDKYLQDLLAKSPDLSKDWLVLSERIFWVSPLMRYKMSKRPPTNYRNILLGFVAAVFGLLWFMHGKWYFFVAFLVMFSIAYWVISHTAETFIQEGKFFMLSSENIYIFDLVYDSYFRSKQALRINKRIALSELTAYQVKDNQLLIYTDSLDFSTIPYADPDLIALLKQLNPEIIDANEDD